MVRLRFHESALAYRLVERMFHRCYNQLVTDASQQRFAAESRHNRA
jgi:hypothetical protein